MGAKRVIEIVCAVLVIDGVVEAHPIRVEERIEAPAPVVETDGAEIVEVAS